MKNFSWDQMVAESYVVGAHILEAILIFIIGKWIAQGISMIIERALLRTHGHKTLAVFVRHLVFYILMAFVLISALNHLGFQTTSLVAVIGAASLAVGLALQGSLSNFAAGVMLILFHPFEVDDTIEAGGAQGRVDEIQIFNTIITQADGKKVIIPNAKITSDKITVFISQNARP